ncbi:MAG: YqeG family HAD IIIA-type phosphatase [Oscillospiraceae bacterium]|nr:YqeG family HAD IIIA-type phosphatase [Oscillospiraceae bacterium]
MAFSLLPNLILDAATDLTPDLLLGRGIWFLMMDFDNTIVPYTTDIPTRRMTDWITAMRAGGITLCMVSNSHKPRVRTFCDAHAIPCIQAARKPFWRVGIAKALREFDCPPEQAAIVGDQIYTDILGGNGAGVGTVLIRPIHLHNIWLKLRYAAEQPFIILGKRRINREKS